MKAYLRRLILRSFAFKEANNSVTTQCSLITPHYATHSTSIHSCSTDTVFTNMYNFIKYFLMAIILLQYLVKTNSSDRFFLDNNYNPEMIKIISETIKNKFLISNTTLFINELDSAETPNTETESGMILRQIYNNEKTRTLIVGTDDVKLPYRVGVKYYNAFIVLKTCRKLIKIAREYFISRLAYVIVLIPGEMFEGCRKMIDFNLDYFIWQNLTIIITNNENESISTITFVIEREEKVRSIKAAQLIHVLQTKTNGSIEYTRTHFIQNYRDRNGAPLKIGIINQYPYASIKNWEKLSIYDPVNNAIGADIELLKIIAKFVNMSVEFHYLKPYGDEGEELYANVSIYKYFDSGELEVAAGGLFRLFGDRVDYSGSYTRQAIFWVYSIKVGNRSWRTFLKRINGFYYFLLFYVVYSAVGCMLNYELQVRSRKRIPLCDILIRNWGALLGCIALTEPRSLKEKLLNLLYLVLCLHFSAYLSVQLYAFLTIIPPPKRYLDNDELMATNKTPYMWPIFMNFNEDEKYVQFIKRYKYCSGFVDCANSTIKYDGVAVLMDSTFDWIQDMYGTRAGEARLAGIPEHLLTVYHEMLLRRGSLIANDFRWVLKRMLEAGINEELLKRTKGLTTVSRAQILTEDSMKNSYSCESGCPIGFEQCLGVFYILTAGWTLSLGIFLFEILSKRQQK